MSMPRSKKCHPLSKKMQQIFTKKDGISLRITVLKFLSVLFNNSPSHGTCDGIGGIFDIAGVEKNIIRPNDKALFIEGNRSLQNIRITEIILDLPFQQMLEFQLYNRIIDTGHQNFYEQLGFF